MMMLMMISRLTRHDEVGPEGLLSSQTQQATAAAAAANGL
jgi:hypothetical protein